MRGRGALVGGATGAALGGLGGSLAATGRMDLRQLLRHTEEAASKAEDIGHEIGRAAGRREQTFYYTQNPHKVVGMVNKMQPETIQEITATLLKRMDPAKAKEVIQAIKPKETWWSRVLG